MVSTLTMVGSSRHCKLIFPSRLPPCTLPFSCRIPALIMLLRDGPAECQSRKCTYTVIQSWPLIKRELIGDGISCTFLSRLVSETNGTTMKICAHVHRTWGQCGQCFPVAESVAMQPLFHATKGCEALLSKIRGRRCVTI